MSYDRDFLRSMHIEAADIDPAPEPGDGLIPGAHPVELEVEFCGDEAIVDREMFVRIAESNTALHAAAVRWCQEAGREHGRAERYRRMSIGLMLACAGLMVGHLVRLTW